eukprot:COSAG02_NODE_326_length_24603_cov_123.455681_20_plen_87_part_01
MWDDCTPDACVNQPADWDADWNALSQDLQGAAEVLGYDETSWDCEECIGVDDPSGCMPQECTGVGVPYTGCVDVDECADETDNCDDL